MKARKGFKPVEKNMMMLSPETLQGLRITGMFCVIGGHYIGFLPFLNFCS